jgi:CubicO group peptidase (beta-lactamase class C family)
MKCVKNIILISVLLLNSILCRAQQLYFPPLSSGDWEMTSPASLGWCEEKTDTLYSFLESNNTKAFMVLKDGKIVLEKYFGTFKPDSLWYWASAGKTLTATLAGIAVEEGFLSLDLPVSDYLGAGWSMCPPEKEILIHVRNQITMTSGLNDAVTDPDCTSPECLQYLADAGTRWAYHNAPYTLLEEVIPAATGLDFNAYFNSRIRNKTGMNGLWISLGYNHIYFSSARSMARFGLLLLAEGKWDSQPVLSDTSFFMAMVNSSQTMNRSYGYLTWLNGKASYMLPQSQFVFPGFLCPDAPEDMFSAMGKNGQIVNVVPSEGLVVIRMGNAPDNQYEIPNVFNNLIWQQLNNVICSSSGIREQKSESSKFEIYPNPASTAVNIIPANSVGNYQTLLFDVEGKLHKYSENTQKLDVSHILPGIYTLLITQNGIKTHFVLSIIR